MDDKFKIILTPTFDINKDAIQHELNKITIPTVVIPVKFDFEKIKLGKDIDLANLFNTEKLAENINKAISKELTNIKPTKIKTDVEFSEKEIQKSLEDAIKKVDTKNAKKDLSKKIMPEIPEVSVQQPKGKILPSTKENDLPILDDINRKRGIFEGILDLSADQAVLYKELLKQEKLLETLYKNKEKGFVGNKEDYDNIITSQKKIIQNIKDAIAEEQLYNEEVEKRKLSLSEIRRLAELDKQQKRTAKIGKEVDFDTNLKFDSTHEELEDFFKNLSQKEGTFEKLTSNVTKIQDLNNAQRQFSATFKTGAGFVTEYTYAIDKATNKVFELGEKVKRTTTSISGFSGYFQEIVKKVTEWNLAFQLIIKSVEFLKNGINFMVDLDEQLTAVALVSGRTREQVEGLKESFVSFARETKQTVAEISKLNVELTRQGLSAEETANRMATISKLSSVSGLNTEATLRTITSSVNALAESAQRTADILVYADNNSASSVDSIGKALSRVSSIAKGTGFSIEQTTAIISTLIDVTQEAPETLGNALKSIFARFSKVNELGEVNKDINDVAKAYKAAKIEFTDFTGQIRDKFQLLTELADKWGTLDDKTRSYIATLVAGSLQQNRFLVLMQNWDRVTKMFNNLENFSEGSLEKGFATWEQGLVARINNLKVSFEELWITIMDEDVARRVIDNLAKFIDILTSISKHIPTLRILGYAIAYIFASNHMKKNGKDFNEYLLGIAKNIGKLIPLLKNFRQIMQKQTSTTSQATKAQINFKDSLNLVTAKAKVATNAIKGLTISTKLLRSLAGFGLSTLFTELLFFASNKLFGEKDNEFVNFSEQYKELHSNFRDSIATLKDVKNEYEVLSKIVGENTDLSKLNNSERERFIAINEQITSIAPEVIGYWDTELGAMVKYGTKIEDIIKLKEELYLIEKKALRNDLKESSKDDSEKLQKLLKQQKELNIAIEGNPFATSSEDYPIGYLQQLSNLQEKLRRDDLSDREREKLNKEINEINYELSKKSTALAKTKKDINELIGGYKELLSIDVNEYLKKTNVELSQNLKELVLSSSNKILQEQAIKNPKKLAKAFDISDVLSLHLVETVEKMQNLLNDLTPQDISDNIQGIDELEANLVKLGVSSDVASNFITNLALGLANLREANADATEPIILLEKKISGLTEELNNFRDVYDKSVKGNLGFAESFKFLNDQEGVIEKINEGMTVQNAIRETSLELMNKTNLELEKELTIAQEELNLRKQNLLTTIDLQKKNLKGLEDLGKSSSIQYRELNDSLVKNQESLKSIDEQIEQGKKTLVAYKAVVKDVVSKDQSKEISEQFKKSTDNILKLKGMIDTISNEGITSNILTDIINNYPELIDFLDNEIQLKQELNNLLTKEEDLQKNSYRLKIMYSETFANSFMKINANMINDLSKKYGVDLNNFATLQSKKMALLDSMSKKVASYNDEFSGSLANMTTSEITSQITTARTELSKLQNQLKQDANNSLVLEMITSKQHEIATLQDALKFNDKIDSSVDKLFNKVDFEKINANTANKKTSSSSREKQRKYLDLVDLENDKYLKMNKLLEENNRLKEKNNKLISYASGKIQIELIQKENKLLTDRQKLLHQLANQYREEQKSLEKQLSKVIKINTDDYGLDNYSKFIVAKEKEINNLITKINATTNESMIESLTEKKDVLQKKVNDISENYKRYIEIVYNSIPSLQDEYGDLAFQKLDNTLKLITSKVEKFNADISRLNIFKEIRITKKEDKVEDLNRQLELQKEIFNINEKQLSVIEKEVQKSKENVTILESKLGAISNKNSSEYNNIKNELIQAKKLSSEVIAVYETVIQSYTDSLNNRINVELQMLDKIRDGVKKSITDLRKEKENFSLNEFIDTIKTIENAIDRIDKNFISNPTTILDTNETRDTLDRVLNDIIDIRNNTERWKNSIQQVVKSNKSNKEIIEDVKRITSQMVVAENKLTEEIEKRRKENNALKLEYEKIEDSLQNLIDVKQKEIDKYKEELEHNQKVNSLIEARLNLLRSMDDTSYEYITGTGEVEWTYNKSQVSENLKQLANLLNQNASDEKLSKMEQELKEMVENLETTKKIHQQNLEINTAQLAQLEKERDYISNLVDKSLEQIDKSFEKVSQDYISEMDTLLRKNTSVLVNIYDLLRENIGTGFKYSNLRNNQNLAEKYNIKDNVLQTLQEKLNYPSMTGYNLDNMRIGNDMRSMPTLSGINPSQVSQSNTSNNSTNITIHSINLDKVNDARDFINYLQNMARNGINRLN